MIARSMALLLALGLVACGDQVVHVRFSGDRTWPGCLPEDHGLDAVWVVNAELRIGSATSQGWRACIGTYGTKTTLVELEREFSKITFNYVPPEGPWTMWIIGFPQGDGCRDRPTQTPLLCGTTQGDLFPPPDNQMIVSIDCMPRASTTEQLIKEKLKSCAFPIYP